MQAAQTVMKWLIILGVLGMIGWAIFSAKTAMNMKTTTVYAGKAILRAQIAKDDAAKEKGLAGRAQIARDEAMIFVFDKDGDIPIWMKGMETSIDIIWLNDKKKVVHVENNVEPDFEPHQVYRSPLPARYVLETRAGTAKKFGIKPGLSVRFELEDQK